MIIQIDGHSVESLLSDKARLDWLETQVINVRTPLPHGSRDLFWCSADEDEPSDLRTRIDLERFKEK